MSDVETKTAFTAGPWVFSGPAGGNLCIMANLPDGKTWFVASCTTKRIWYGETGIQFESVEVESIANAHLIAAAPEMYAFIERCSSWWAADSSWGSEARALLAKARGEQ